MKTTLIAREILNFSETVLNLASRRIAGGGTKSFSLEIAKELGLFGSFC